MSLFLFSSGLLNTIQDLGRTGFRRFGINPNGAMDVRAARLINSLLGNDENEAVLEMHFPAPQIRFDADALAALGGADFTPELNGKPMENWRPLQIKAGGCLSFAGKRTGARSFLAVRGGFALAPWLGSGSTNLIAAAGGLAGRALRKGDCLFFRQTFKAETQKPLGYKISPDLIPAYNQSPTIRVTPGAEWSALTNQSREKFVGQTFSILPQSDRMGFRLAGEPLRLGETSEMISSAVNFGAVQLLPDGQLIVLMADHQTTGGYPRVAHVTATDLPLLAQLEANNKLRFKLISLAQAENLSLEFEKNLNLLKTACRLR